jgi:cytochrome c-type biogenesis protein CcmH
MRAGFAALLAGLAIVAGSPAAALAATPHTTLPDVEDEVMCPVCGTPLNQAQAPQAERERELIRSLIAQGMTKEQIKRRLVDEYGPGVLASPPPEGFSLAAYLVPVGLGVLAVALLAFALTRWRRRPVQPEAAPAALSATDADRLADDLARHDA